MNTKHLSLLLLSSFLAQAQKTVLLTMDIDNTIIYVRDVYDNNQLGTRPDPTPSTPGRGFSEAFGLGDIVSIDGQRVKGTFTTEVIGLRITPTPLAGQAIADTDRTGTLMWSMEVAREDGTHIGALYAMGLNGNGIRQPAPGGGSFFNMVIVGGTGPWLGMRGEVYGLARPGSGNRNPSMSEDPALRRVNGPWQLRRHLLHLVPMNVPTIVENGVLHANDLTPVTAARPAKPGETLVLRVAHLGPTVPYTEPGAAFPHQPLAVVNSPVDILIGDRSIPALNQVGWPGSLTDYRVDFVVPMLPADTYSLKVRCAFIPGEAIRLPVQP